MSFLLSFFMLSKHSLHPKHSSQQGPNSSVPGSPEVAAASQGGSVSPLQSTKGVEGHAPPEPRSGAAEGTWVHHLYCQGMYKHLQSLQD